MNVEISTLKIKVNKKTVTLTLAESKALFDQLNVIFGPKYNYYPYNTWPYYYGSLNGTLVSNNTNGGQGQAFGSSGAVGLGGLTNTTGLVNNNLNMNDLKLVNPIEIDLTKLNNTGEK